MRVTGIASANAKKASLPGIVKLLFICHQSLVSHI